MHGYPAVATVHHLSTVSVRDLELAADTSGVKSHDSRAHATIALMMQFIRPSFLEQDQLRRSHLDGCIGAQPLSVTGDQLLDRTR
jgi:hypothetical protein